MHATHERDCNSWTGGARRDNRGKVTVMSFSFWIRYSTGFSVWTQLYSKLSASVNEDKVNRQIAHLSAESWWEDCCSSWDIHKSSLWTWKAFTKKKGIIVSNNKHATMALYFRFFLARNTYKWWFYDQVRLNILSRLFWYGNQINRHIVTGCMITGYNKSSYFYSCSYWRACVRCPLKPKWFFSQKIFSNDLLISFDRWALLF